MTAYRPSHRLALIWLMLSLFGVAATLGGFFLLIVRFPDAGMGWGLLPVIGLLLFLAIGLQQVHRADGRRKQAICDALEQQGFSAESPPTAGRARLMFESIAFLAPHLDLRNGADGLRWIAIRRPGHFFFEHEWALGSGRGRTILTRTVLVFQAETSGLPGALLGDRAWLALHRPSLIGERRRIKRLSDPIKTGHPAIDRRWISIGSPATAAAFLGDDVRQRLQRAPRGESWIIGHGFVCCSFQGSFDPPMLRRMWEHAEGVLKCASLRAPTKTQAQIQP